MSAEQSTSDPTSRPAPPCTLRLDEATELPGQLKSVSFTKDANNDTVRSMATLLVMDQSDEEDDMHLSPNTARKGRASPYMGRRATSASSSTNGITPMSIMPEVRDTNDSEDMSDSVFGDIALSARRSSLSKPGEDDEDIGDSPLHRQGSLRSQMSGISSQKEVMKRELKLKTFVSVLFIIIITGVSVVLHFAKLKQYDMTVSMKIIVDQHTRQIRFQNVAKHDLLVGRLGIGIPRNIQPVDCSEDATRQTHLCLKWRKHAQVYVDYWADEPSRCYSVSWQSLHPDTLLKDCLRLKLDTVRWFGGWVSSEHPWPLKKASVPLQPYVTGRAGRRATFGPVLEPYWLASPGASVFSQDPMQLLHVSWNAETPVGNRSVGDDELCLVSGSDHRMYGPSEASNPTLNYTVCISKNLFQVHQLSLKRIQQSRNSSLATVYPDMTLFNSPVWSATKALQQNVTPAALEDLAQRLLMLNLDVGILLIEDHWQAHHGDLEFDPSFTDVKGLLRNLTQQLRCQVAVGLNPYISINSKHFALIVSKQLLVRDGGGMAPGLLSWTTGFSTAQSEVFGALDMTSPTSVNWFTEKLSELRKATSGNLLFNFQGGEASTLPYGAKLSLNETNKNLYTLQYNLMAGRSSKPTIVDSATNVQAHGVIIRVQVPSLLYTIPTVLTLAVLGYPYVLVELSAPPHSADLYIRSVQLAAFLPIMHLTAAPDTYGLEAIDVVRQMTKVHQQVVRPRVVEAQETLVTPLWWLAPDDPVALTIDSEFVVGGDLLVAPIVQQWAVHRDIYLPRGTWFSKERQKYYGPKWLRNYNIPPLEFAYFTTI